MTDPDRQRSNLRIVAMSDANTSRLTLPGVLDMAAAEGFLATMRERLQSGSHLIIDAAAVEALTLPCIQIILAALQTHDGIAIEQPSQAFVSAFADLGLDCSRHCMPDRIAQDNHVAACPDIDAAAEQDIAADTQAAPEESAPIGDAASPAAPEEAPEEAPMAKRILTIDDSKTIRDMLLLTLNEAGFEVLQAVDGQDGLDVLDREQVDVVVTDINMPRMDGYEVIRQMRKNAVHKSTPILVLTTESEAAKRNIAREAGATGWMVKPFDPDRLVATINKVAP
jgi:two-component system, chemotaxis family, chemotaxis protein CheY